MFGKKKSVIDDVILISEQEIRVIPITELTEESVKTGDLTLPRSDAEIKYYPEGGRAFIYGWEGNYLAESESIAQLEKSVALKSMFNFGSSSRATNIQFYVMMAALIITVFLLRG
ncbi:hypothetical protein [Desulforamulus aeronauticus]|uniref:Uncharacterized protein n=1 Tax=Desulforamulus aeronauticus DSM 10349 TaxID=1121421 RepID=A0A1M6WFZ5_9FIRM|nr:hypothetical protein [Desulforamulus aeronauticus]SHK92569.1 hypothetical protein SAMN02745123_03610 [Desulforamulus aeronauticus DSM 10349]